MAVMSSDDEEDKAGEKCYVIVVVFVGQRMLDIASM